MTCPMLTDCTMILNYDITEILKHTYSTIDAEAEFVAEFSEKKINQYKNK